MQLKLDNGFKKWGLAFSANLFEDKPDWNKTHYVTQ